MNGLHLTNVMWCVYVCVLDLQLLQDLQWCSIQKFQVSIILQPLKQNNYHWRNGIFWLFYDVSLITDTGYTHYRDLMEL